MPGLLAQLAKADATRARQKNTLPVQRQPEIRHPREAVRGPEMHNEESLLRALFEADAVGAKGPASLDQLKDIRPESFKVAEMPAGNGKFWVDHLGRSHFVRSSLVHDDFIRKSHLGPKSAVDAIKKGFVRVSNTAKEVNAQFNSDAMGGLEEVRKMARSLAFGGSKKRVHFEDTAGKYTIEAEASQLLRELPQ